MAPVIFLSLPIETWDQILQPLSTTDISAFMQTSMKSFKIAERSLYSSIRLKWSFRRRRTPAADLLLRKILTNPHLAEYIRSLYLIDESSPPKLNISSLVKNRLYEVIEELNISRGLKSLWIERLGQGSADALATVLIAMSRNLTCLHLAGVFTHGNTILGHYLRSVVYSSDHSQVIHKQFYNLREVVTLGKPNDPKRRAQEPNNSADMLSLFYLHHIETLHVSIDNPVQFFWPIKGSSPKTHTLKSLKLEQIRERNLVPLLAAAPSVSQLTWKWICSKRIDTPDMALIDLDTLVEALDPLRETLSELTLGGENGGSGLAFPIINIRGSLAGLKRFAQVRKLTVPWVFMMGLSPSRGRSVLDQLPPNLETLTLTEDLHQYDRWGPPIFQSRQEVEISGAELQEPLKAMRIKALRPDLGRLMTGVIPRLREIIFAWKWERDDDRAYNHVILKELSDLRHGQGIEVSWKQNDD